MAIPQLLSDVVRVLLLLAPSAALLSLVLAGISLRREGGNTFIIGGGFTKWMFWAVVFATLQSLLGWFNTFGVGVALPGGGIGTPWLASFQTDVANFMSNFVMARLVPTLAAFFVLRAVLDVAGGGHPRQPLDSLRGSDCADRCSTGRYRSSHQLRDAAAVDAVDSRRPRVPMFVRDLETRPGDGSLEGDTKCHSKTES